ncbi:MAG: hypothetical protein ACREQB_10130, partial [Candidatus Binataceae bacterium]
IVGTPGDAIARIRELQEATGGFGGILGLAHEWTTREKTLRSYELFARYVMPHFRNGVAAQVEYSNDWSRQNREMLFGKAMAGILTAMREYAEKKVAKGEKVPDIMTIPPTRIRP